MKHAIIFWVGFGLMVTILEFGTLRLLDDRATILSRADTVHCFTHRRTNESC